MPDIVDGTAQVVRAVSEGTVGAIFTAVAFRVRLVNAGAGLIVAQVVAPLRVSGRPVQERTSAQKRHKQDARGERERKRRRCFYIKTIVDQAVDSDVTYIIN